MRTVGALAISGIKSKSETALSSTKSSEVTRSRNASEVTRGKSFYDDSD